MPQKTHKRLILTGWGYTVYACAAALMNRILPGQPEIQGVSMRKLPAYMQELHGYDEIHILGIGLHSDPETFENALRSLKESEPETRIVWYSDRDLHEKMIDIPHDLLETHINYEGLLYAVCDVYPEAEDFTEFPKLLQLAEKPSDEPEPLTAFASEVEFSDTIFKECCFSLLEEPPGTLYQGAAPPKRKVRKSRKESEEIAELRQLIDAAMCYYRNYQDTSLYSHVIRNISSGNRHSLDEKEKKLLAWYKRFGSREIIGKSPAMEKLRADIAIVAAKDQLRVLINGESGTGKENIAEQIHIHSPRADECFLTFNCANVPENLMESRLFGYEKGAFTGAEETTKGLFENADHGTLFLDEIGELSLESQGNLLRVLDSGRFMRVGGHEEIETDVRVICATNRNLAELVRDGRFRMDLFYRLNVARIVSPSLRDHIEDLEEIANHHWKQLTHQTLTAKQIAVLSDYKYPGNVRELFNLLDRANAFGVSDFSAMLAEHIESVRPFAENMPYSSHASDSAPESEVLEDVILRHVVRVFRDTGGQTQTAAKRLGITYNTLRSHLDKAKIRFGDGCC